MIDIDTVYQRVLSLANKEQRGYITPQEFNLFANQAQMSIFDQYFYDYNQFSRVAGNSSEHSDMLDLLEEKIDLFADTEVLNYNSSGFFSLPDYFYKTTSMQYDYGGGNQGDANVIVERVDKKEYFNIINSPLALPTKKRPIYYREGGSVFVFPVDLQGQGVQDLICNFIVKPETVVWSYNVVKGHALYSGNGVHSQLHESEENNLVLKILALAGIVLQDPGVYQIANAEEVKSIQQEKQ